jgi:hypothetical protein
MMGSAQDPGIIPRVCRALFYMIVRQSENNDARSYAVEASYLEIYNEVRMKCTDIYIYAPMIALIYCTSPFSSTPDRRISATCWTPAG